MRAWMYFILFSMACVAGVSLVFSAITYSEYTNRIASSRATDPGRISKSIEIISTDRETGMVRARALDSPLESTDEIAFVVNERSVIERRLPIIENGAIVGLNAPSPAALADIAPGIIAFARLAVEKAGKLWARYLLLDDPLTSVE